MKSQITTTALFECTGKAQNTLQKTQRLCACSLKVASSIQTIADTGIDRTMQCFVQPLCHLKSVMKWFYWSDTYLFMRFFGPELKCLRSCLSRNYQSVPLHSSPYSGSEDVYMVASKTWSNYGCCSLKHRFSCKWLILWDNHGHFFHYIRWRSEPSTFLLLLKGPLPFKVIEFP